MIAKDLEAKIIAAIADKFAAIDGLPAHQIIGVWQPSIAGAVKNEEDPATVAMIAVAISTASHGTYTAPDVSFRGAVGLTVKIESDPTGSALVQFAEPIEDLFKAWQSDTYQQAFTALDLDNLSVDEISIGDAQPPAIDTRRGTVSLAFPFSISGSYRDTTQTTNP